MRWPWLAVALAMLTLGASCGDAPITEWGGEDTEGGEVLLERVVISSTITGGEPRVEKRFHAYAYDGVGGAPFGFGHCQAINDRTWPFNVIGSGASYTDFGERIHLSGPELEIDVPKVVAGPEGLRDNRLQVRPRHGEGSWIYGGPSWQGEALADASLQPGGEFEVALSETDVFSLQLPPVEGPLGKIDREEVRIPSGGDWVAKFDGPNEPIPAVVHFLRIVSFTSLDGAELFYVCYADYDQDENYEFVVDEGIIEDLPEEGIIHLEIESYGKSYLYNELAHANRRLDVIGSQHFIGRYRKVGVGLAGE